MPAIEVGAVVVGVRYRCDQPDCAGEHVKTGEIMPHYNGSFSYEHRCTACKYTHYLPRTYPGYDIKVEPLL